MNSRAYPRLVGEPKKALERRFFDLEAEAREYIGVGDTDAEVRATKMYQRNVDSSMASSSPEGGPWMEDKVMWFHHLSIRSVKGAAQEVEDGYIHHLVNLGSGVEKWEAGTTHTWEVDPDGPWTDVCIYCGWDNGSNSEYRMGWDCGWCGGN